MPRYYFGVLGRVHGERGEDVVASGYGALEHWSGWTMIPFVASAGMREHTNFQILVSFLPFQVACVPLGTLALQECRRRFRVDVAGHRCFGANAWAFKAIGGGVGAMRTRARSATGVWR